MKTISLKDLAPKDTPGDGWYIIEAAGDHPHTIEDSTGAEVEFTLHVPTEVLEKIAETGVPEDGILVDKDHLSHDMAQSTEAYGWVRELAMCEGNLAARIEWTPLGKPLVEGKVYKHFSTEYMTTDEEVHSGSASPTKLTGLALTNRPANKAGQPPISSREGGEPLTPGHGGQGEDKKQPQNCNMNAEILAELGLAEDATEEDVLNAIRDLKSAQTAAETAEVSALVSSEEAACDVQLTEEEKEEIIEKLVENREFGMKYLRLVCSDKAAKKQPAARKYDDKSGRAVAPANKTNPNKDALALNSRAKEIIAEGKKSGQRISWRKAFAQAERESISK